jgi:hypothetical protein
MSDKAMAAEKRQKPVFDKKKWRTQKYSNKVKGEQLSSLRAPDDSL